MDDSQEPKVVAAVSNVKSTQLERRHSTCCGIGRIPPLEQQQRLHHLVERSSLVGRRALSKRHPADICEVTVTPPAGCDSRQKSPSSASDSALSRSQATLESEIDTSFGSSSNDTTTNGEGSSTSDGSFGMHRASDSTIALADSAGSCNSDDDDDDQFSASQNRSQFDIIWRNLSYSVPSGHLDNLVERAKALKARLMPVSLLSSSTKTTTPTTTTPPPSECLRVQCTNVHQHQHQQQQHQPTPPPGDEAPRKLIFSDLCGCAKSGQLTAVLGPSGAGKTTLLKCLTSVVVRGVSGTIQVAGNAPSSRLKLCIIPQKDYLFDHLTVMENLIFASRIKNTALAFDHPKNVERVADLLRLRSCLSIKTSKLSGGQYKRVSIAQELLSKPDILVLDEPTSGLDSLTCFKTVSVLRDLVDMSRKGLMPPLAIIMTIHQPQAKIFNLFHRVYVLSSLGQCVYEGKPSALIETVADCCKLLPPPDDLNAASFIIDLASEEYGRKPVGQLARFQRKQFELAKFGQQQQHNSNHHHHHHQHQDQALVFDGLLTTSKRRSELSSSSNSTQTSSSSSATNININMQDNEEEEEEALTIVTSSIATQTAITTTSTTTNNSKNTKRHKQTKAKLFQELNGGALHISRALMRRNRKHRGDYWLHVSLLVRRLWISMWRDSLLTTTRVMFHLIIPFIFYVIYNPKSGAANACPHIEREYDFKTMTSDESIQRLAVQHNELILTFENISLFFLLLYSFSMCVLAITALSFPLNMHILLKETSNGWYSMSRFVAAKTLADLPIEITMPMISVAIAYVLTGQPSSYLCWRMVAVTAVMTICSLISQTQGLMFGALFMNNVSAAVFVSQASSLPWILLSGFTTRVSELPRALQWLSFGSIYRLGIESIMSVRYGYGMCPCDSTLVADTPTKLVGIPDQLRSLMRYYLDSYSASSSSSSSPSSSSSSSLSSSSSMNTSMSDDSGGASTQGDFLTTGDQQASNSSIVSKLVANITSTVLSNLTTDVTTNPPASLILGDDASLIDQADSLAATTTIMPPITTSAPQQDPDIFQKIATTLSLANSYGTSINTCDDVRPFVLTAREVHETTLPTFMAILFGMFIALRILLFYAVKFRVNTK